MRLEYVFIGIVLAACLYELVALGTPRQGDTISEIVWRVTSARPLLPFLVGLLCGHFFWQRVS